MYCRSDRDLIGDTRNIRDYRQNRRDIRDMVHLIVRVSKRMICIGQQRFADVI